MSERNLNFEQGVNRKGTRCLKYDFAVQRGRSADLLPLWVADMDFKTSSYIQDALLRQAEHGVYGYTEADEAYFDAVRSWDGAPSLAGRSNRNGCSRHRELSLHLQWQ